MSDHRARRNVSDVPGEIRTILTNTRIFKAWPAAAIDALAAGSTFQTYGAGDFVAHAGDSGAGAWLIADGCTSTSVTLEDGREILYEYQLPGQFTGLLPNFDGQPLAFDIAAVTDVKLVFIRRQALLDVIQSDVAFAMEMVRMLCRRARVDYEHLLTKTVDPPRVQLAKFLIYFVRGPEASVGERQIPIRITQDMLAKLLGVRRQTINREMKRLINDEIVAHKYGEVTVLDLPQLIKVASEGGSFFASAQAVVFERPDSVRAAAD